MVAFYCHRCPMDRDGLDDVGIERALQEKFNRTQFLCFSFEYFDKGFADCLSLLLWIGESLQGVHELFASIDADNIEFEI